MSEYHMKEVIVGFVVVNEEGVGLYAPEGEISKFDKDLEPTMLTWGEGALKLAKEHGAKVAVIEQTITRRQVDILDPMDDVGIDIANTTPTRDQALDEIMSKVRNKNWDIGGVM